MNKLLTIAAALLLCHRGHAQSTPAEVKELLRQCVDVQHRAPGIVAGWVDKNGVTLVAWGKDDESSSNQVNGDTIFEIGSITKVFTGLLLQDMADRGELRLDDPITNFLPTSVKAPSRKGREITLRNLATHSSGLPRLPDNMSPKDADNPYADYTVDQMYAFLSSYKLKRDIGSKSEYSNFGMGLLGHILALRAKTNYESLVVTRICAPLDMESTRITLTPELEARLTPGHSEVGTRVANWDLPTLAGAGALRSSANDLLKFVSAEMGLAPSPLSHAMQETQKPQKPKGFLSRIGLSWQIDNKNDLIWHNGGTGGYRSYMGFNKDRTLGVVVLANSANDIDDLGLHLLGAQDKIDLTPKRQAVKVDANIYDGYLGQYKFNWGGILTVTRKGDRLFAQLQGQGANEIFPASPTDFFLTVVDAQITFDTNSNGTAASLVLHQNGADMKAEKLAPGSVPPPKKRVVAKIDYGVYDRYVGQYKLGADGAAFTITRDGNHLFAQLTGQDSYEVFPESKTDFFYTIVDAQLTFVTDAAGKVTQLVLHQGGLDQNAIKMKSAAGGQ